MRYWLASIILGVFCALASILFASASSTDLPSADGSAPKPRSVVEFPSSIQANQSITATSTVTPLLQAITVTTTGMATTCSGPGSDYPEIATFTAGLTFDAIGRFTDDKWVVVRVSKWQNAWMPAILVIPGGEIQALAEIALPEISAAAVPIPAERAVISVRNLSGANSSIRLTVSGLTAGQYYMVELVNQKGKVFFKRGANANENGFLDFVDHFSSTTITSLNPGIYLVNVFKDSVLIGSKQFILSKKLIPRVESLPNGDAPK